ncbi:MAG: hypothetical protein WD078_00430 [Woeseia sp.]
MPTWLLLVLAIISLALIPFAPQLLRLRLKFLRWIHWDWAATLLEKYFDRWVIVLRIFLIVVAGVLLYLGWENLRA